MLRFDKPLMRHGRTFAGHLTYGLCSPLRLDVDARDIGGESNAVSRFERLRREIDMTIPSKQPRVRAEIYEWRDLIENFFGKLKEFKRIAMRGDKTDRSFKAIVYLVVAVSSNENLSLEPIPYLSREGGFFGSRNPGDEPRGVRHVVLIIGAEALDHHALFLPNSESVKDADADQAGQSGQPVRQQQDLRDRQKKNDVYIGWRMKR